MPSRDNPLRARSEHGLHLLALLLLGTSLLSAWRERSRGGAEETVRSPELGAALERWSTVASPVAIEARLDHPPRLVDRDWLAALPGAGTRVAWSGQGLVATAMALLPSADPEPTMDLLVAAPSGTVLATGVAHLDSARVEGGMVRLQLPASAGGAQVDAGGLAAHAALRDTLIRKRILVLARAGWEAKFTIAVLEERGWTVDVHLALAPGGDIAQGISSKAGGSTAPQSESAAPVTPVAAPSGRGIMRTFADQRARLTTAVQSQPTVRAAPIEIDTARYAAVLALDSVAARESARVARFVRNGGGLLLWPEAASAPGLAALAPATNQAAGSDPAHHFAGVVTFDSLSIRSLTGLKPDAIVLLRRGALVTLAAWRVGPGRVVQLGQEELWRWRMGGDEQAAGAHRAWLGRLVSGAALAPRQPLETTPGDAAPYAALVDRLGLASNRSSQLAAAVSGALNAWTFAFLCGALLIEWLSRRLRSRP